MPPLLSALNDFLNAADDEAALAWLREQVDPLLMEEARHQLVATVAQASDPAQRVRWQQRLALFELVDVTRLLVGWIETPDWVASAAFLRQHAARLVSETGVATLHALAEANAADETVSMHLDLLQACLAQGVDAVYAAIQQRQAAAAAPQNPTVQALLEFLQAPSAADAQTLLVTQRDRLLTADARTHLIGLLAANRDNAELVAHLQARLTLWEAVRRAQTPAPLRGTPPPSRPADEDPQPQPRPESGGGAESSRENRYTVINPQHCAIGDNATLLQIFNVGQLALRWQRPLETRPNLTRGSVGRQQELAELHQRLTAQQGSALVSVGTAAAVRGQAGIGKSVLAAMYVEQYGQHYPGGVFWLDSGPDRRTAASVIPSLLRLLNFLWQDGVQAQRMLQNHQFAAETIQMLLRGHGNLLVVIDDVWSEAVVETLKAAFPPEAALLLTTRDYDVAFALQAGAGAIQVLDVLSADDGRILLQSKVAKLSDALADSLTSGLGYHAQALTLAAGALARQGASRYAQTSHEILQRVAAGRGFGDLPRLDKADRLTPVEVALKYSYDLLSEGNQGGENQDENQRAFRLLGVFAQEASFEAAAAAAVWQTDAAAGTTSQAEARLLLYSGLALLQEGAPGRWQQHALLRAYALSLQTADERLAGAERHADYYLRLARACYASQPRDYARMARELKQSEHAFAWCRQQSLARAVELATAHDDFLRNRGYTYLLADWLQAALHGAEQIGSRLGKANTLKSLGDLERRLGNVEQARQHYDAALPLYEAEQDRLGKANTLTSLGDLESRLGNVEQARQHYDAALPLYEAEQARLGKANTLKSLGDLERRLGNVEQARQHYDAALPLYEAEQDRLGKANTLTSLGDLESRLGNVEQARQHYDAALPLYEAEQARLGKANTLTSLGDLERRLGNVEQARQHYDAALPLYEAEQARLGKANTLTSLGDLERRLGNVEQARQHYDAALPLYEAEQARLGKANTLTSLGDLESRLGNVEQARQHYDAALPLYEAEQDPVGQMNVFVSQARLAAGLGEMEDAHNKFLRVFAIAEQIGFANHPVTQDLRREYAQLIDGSGESASAPGEEEEGTEEVQALAAQLIEWVNTASWPTSQAFLQTHATTLLSDAAAAVLALLIEANPNAPVLLQHQALLRRARQAGVVVAYAEVETGGTGG